MQEVPKDGFTEHRHRDALGSRLRELREEALGRRVKGLSLAAALGCSRHSVWEWEAGRHIPRTKTLEKIARYFASGDEEREAALRGELLDLGARAVDEAHRENVRLPSSGASGGLWASGACRSQGQRASRLSCLDPVLVRACGDLFGLDHRSAGEEVAARLAEGPVSSSGDRSWFTPLTSGPPSDAREAMARYYDDDLLGRGTLCAYSIEINGTPHRAAIATRRQWTGLSIPLASVGATLPTEVCRLGRTPGQIADVDWFREAAFDFLRDIETGGLEVYDAPIFRLRRMAVRHGSLEMDLALDSFVRWRFTIGLLGEELRGALGRAELGALLGERQRWFPLRSRFLPDGAALARPLSRICSGGVAALTAIARGRRQGDFVLLVQRRGRRVSEPHGHGVLTTIPQAFHQPVGLLHGPALQKEVRVSSTLYRELFEEALGGREAELSGRELEPDWYLQASRPLRWLRDHPESYGAWCVGLGFNLVSGNYEAGILLAIHDPRFWDTFEHQIRPNWEVDDLKQVTTARSTDAGDLEAAALLEGPGALDGWTGEGLVALVEGLARLRAMHPGRTPLPGLQLRRLRPREENLV